MNQMDTPKKRFLLDDAQAQEWARITKSPLFIRAVDAAMAEMVEQQPLSEENAPNSMLGRTYHLQGARKFRNILETIGDKQPEPSTKKPEINYGAQ